MPVPGLTTAQKEGKLRAYITLIIDQLDFRVVVFHSKRGLHTSHPIQLRPNVSVMVCLRL
jgi:hypothetical protein